MRQILTYLGGSSDRLFDPFLLIKVTISRAAMSIFNDSALIIIYEACDDVQESKSSVIR